MNFYALIMAGGQGTRFWPESTSKRPKQYLNLVGDKSLLYQTLDRFEEISEIKNRYVVTVKAQEVLVKESSDEQLNDNNIVFEPAGRNTAPCILLSLAKLLADGASLDDVVGIVPSDHVILNKTGFAKTLNVAKEVAASHKKIVTIGIRPNFPHTGFGYIHGGSELTSNAFNVQGFKEKPSVETATEYLKSGEYYWNAGMFVSTISTLLAEFEVHAPDMFKYFDDLKKNINDFGKISELYSKLPSDSIDYALMEKSKNIAVIPAEFDWNDLGSWDALESVIESKNSNTFVAESESYIEGASGNIIFAPGKFVSLINVNDMIIVSNEKSLVVLPKKDSQKVKNIVNFLKEKDFGKELL